MLLKNSARLLAIILMMLFTCKCSMVTDAMEDAYVSWDLVRMHKENMRAYPEKAHNAEVEASRLFLQANKYFENDMCDEAQKTFEEAEEQKNNALFYSCQYDTEKDLSTADEIANFQFTDNSCSRKLFFADFQASARNSYRNKVCSLRQVEDLRPFFFNNSYDSQYRESLDLYNKKYTENAITNMLFAAYTGSVKAALFLGQHYLSNQDGPEAYKWYNIANMMSEGQVGKWEIAMAEISFALVNSYRGSTITFGPDNDPLYLRLLNELEETTSDPDKLLFIYLTSLCHFKEKKGSYHSSSSYNFVEREHDFDYYKDIIEKVRILAQNNHELSQKIISDINNINVFDPNSEECKNKFHICNDWYQGYWFTKMHEMITPWIKAFENKGTQK